MAHAEPELSPYGLASFTKPLRVSDTVYYATLTRRGLLSLVQQLLVFGQFSNEETDGCRLLFKIYRARGIEKWRVAWLQRASVPVSHANISNFHLSMECPVEIFVGVGFTLELCFLSLFFSGSGKCN